jgi:ribosomal protein S18 acetylase RimI-like enzyme
MANESGEARFPAPDGPMRHRENAEDSALFGMHVYELSCADAAPEDVRRRLPELLAEWSAGGACLASTKVGADQTALGRALCQIGFYLADSQIRLAADAERLSPIEAELPFRSRLFQVGPDRVEEVAELAGRTFDADRLHRDPNIPSDAVDERYRRWIRRTTTDGSLLLAFEDQDSGRIASFVQVRETAPREGQLVLGGADPALRGARYGATMLGQFALECRRRGFANLSTVVALNNLGLIRTYVKMGFLPTDATHVFHWHHSSKTT